MKFLRSLFALRGLDFIEIIHSYLLCLFSFQETYNSTICLQSIHFSSFIFILIQGHVLLCSSVFFSLVVFVVRKTAGRVDGPSATASSFTFPTCWWTSSITATLLEISWRKSIPFCCSPWRWKIIPRNFTCYCIWRSTSNWWPYAATISFR